MLALGTAAADPAGRKLIDQKAIYGPDSRQEHAAQTQEWKDIGDATAMILMPNCASLSYVFDPADSNGEREIIPPPQLILMPSHEIIPPPLHSSGERELTYSTTLGQARGTIPRHMFHAHAGTAPRRPATLRPRRRRLRASSGS